jgi:hypothetical protein
VPPASNRVPLPSLHFFPASECPVALIPTNTRLLIVRRQIPFILLTQLMQYSSLIHCYYCSPCRSRRWTTQINSIRLSFLIPRVHMFWTKQVKNHPLCPIEPEFLEEGQFRLSLKFRSCAATSHSRRSNDSNPIWRIQQVVGARRGANQRVVVFAPRINKQTAWKLTRTLE